LQKQIAGIVTDSRAPGQRKEAEGSAVFQIYQAFASPAEAATLRQAFADGIGWGDAKQRLFERLDSELAPMRERYQALIADPARIEATLLAGAQKARAIAAPLMTRLRQAVGLRPLQSGGPGAPSSRSTSADATLVDAASAGGSSARTASSTGTASAAASAASGSAAAAPTRPAAPIFKQYRERDGKFYFKLVSPQGRTLLQSLGFDSPKEAGEVIATFQAQGAAALAIHRARLQELPGLDPAELAPALDRLTGSE
jgi:tryptophanyl-tRNA synthetase